MCAGSLHKLDVIIKYELYYWKTFVCFTSDCIHTNISIN